jgi:Mn-dependent transcriptional regulator
MELHESGEMYLETIFILKKKNEYVRSIDIANMMNFSKPSVSRAIKILKESGMITMDQKGYIDFTQEGEERAQEVYNKHITLTHFLIHIGVQKDIAEEDACRIEHIMSDETYECIKKFLEKQS